MIAAGKLSDHRKYQIVDNGKPRHMKDKPQNHCDKKADKRRNHNFKSILIDFGFFRRDNTFPA